MYLEFEVIHDDVKATKKDDALRLAVSQLANEFSEELMLSLQKFFGVRRAQVISTGSLKLDIALGMGRLPKGRIVEIYGRETAGKTTLALQVIKEARKHRGYCAYLDVENALDASLVESIGVNIEKFLVSHPDCAENVLSMVDTLTKSGAVDVIVVDSVAALLPKRELDQLVPLSDKPFSGVICSLGHLKGYPGRMESGKGRTGELMMHGLTKRIRPQKRTSDEASDERRSTIHGDSRRRVLETRRRRVLLSPVRKSLGKAARH
ncbi:uncharacterized protein DS421_3g72550 [Arachis hypogaea]|nr:uncharacterized protein DS421_3g72550 [Arachis hypogaea]